MASLIFPGQERSRPSATRGPGSLCRAGRGLLEQLRTPRIASNTTEGFRLLRLADALGGNLECSSRIERTQQNDLVKIVVDFKMLAIQFSITFIHPVPH
jgi:hypothetical protein